MPTEAIETLEALWPLAPSGVEVASLAPRPKDLDGRRVAFIWDYGFRGDEMFALIEHELTEHFGGVVFVSYDEFGDIHGADEDKVIDGLPARLREHAIDFAVVAVGACGSCTPATIRATIVAEQAGVPAVAIVASAFLPQARAIAQLQGMADVSILEYPGVPLLDTASDLKGKVTGHVFGQLLAALEPVTDEVRERPLEPTDGEPVRGTFEEIQERFYANGWTDGLPIVPPTRTRVDALLERGGRPADEVLGALPPEGRLATVESVAVNGVMAGCLPEHMPVLLAAAEAVIDPAYRSQDAGSTPGWEPLLTVGGPLVEELGFSTTTGLMRVGCRANSAIGRFLRLFLRNVAGLRCPPHGDTDSGAIGATFNVVLAEESAASTSIGWDPDHVERGFGLEDSVASVQSIFAISPPIYCGGDELAVLTEPLVHHLASTCGPWIWTGLRYREWHPLLLLTPPVAAAIARLGWTKDDLRRHLYEEAFVDADVTERYQSHGGGTRLPIEQLVADSGFPDALVPGRGVRALLRPDWLRIMVAGHPGRNQARYYVNNHTHGKPVSRLVAARG